MTGVFMATVFLPGRTDTYLFGSRAVTMQKT
jgi:hypothetical protein